MEYYDEVDCINDRRDLPNRILYLEQIIMIAKAAKRDTLWYEQEFEEAKLKLSAVSAKLQSQIWSQPTKDVQTQLLAALKYLLVAKFKQSSFTEEGLKHQLDKYFSCALLPNRLPDPETINFKDDGSVNLERLKEFATEAIALLSGNDFEDYISLEKAFLKFQAQHRGGYENN